MDDSFALALMVWAWEYCNQECQVNHCAEESCPYWAVPIALTKMIPRTLAEQNLWKRIRATVILWANGRDDTIGRSAGPLMKEYLSAYIQG